MNTPEILIYTSTICPYCIMAKRLLTKKGVSYNEINIDREARMREKMMRETNRRTVPQIFIGDDHIGGFDELYTLETSKKLDALLSH